MFTDNCCGLIGVVCRYIADTILYLQTYCQLAKLSLPILALSEETVGGIFSH